MKHLLKIKLVAIFLLTGITLNAQDIKRFLGTYSITAGCYYYGVPSHGLIFETRTVVIEAGIESDLLIHFSIGVNERCLYTNVKAFVLNDSSFIIPEEHMECEVGVLPKQYIVGNGVIRNDSICLSYEYGRDNYDFSAICDNCKEGTSSIVLQIANQNKVYYNAIKQEIVINETLQNQSLTLELYDMLGKIIVRQTNAGNTVSIANLPNGVYVYRLLENDRVVSRGKIVRNN